MKAFRLYRRFVGLNIGKEEGGITATLNTDEVCWNVVYALRTDILYIDNFSGHQDYEVMSNV